jgi:hypothetical protein
MMHGHENSDLIIVAMANKAEKVSCRGGRSGAGGAKGGAKGNAHQQSTYWTLSQVRASQALERIRRLMPPATRGGSRIRKSCTYGSGRGACDETHFPLPARVNRRELLAFADAAAWPAAAEGQQAPLPTIGYIGSNI